MGDHYRKGTNDSSSYEIVLTIKQCQQMLGNVHSYVYPPLCLFGFCLNLLCIIVFSNKKFRQNSAKHVMFKYLFYKSVFDAIILFLKAIHPFVDYKESNEQKLEQEFSNIISTIDSLAFLNHTGEAQTIGFMGRLDPQSFGFISRLEPEEINLFDFLKQSYPMQLFKLITLYYLIYVCTLCSIVFELAAQIDRLITISCAKCYWSRFRYFPSYKMIALLIFLVSALGYTFKLFMNTIIKVKTNRDNRERTSYSIKIDATDRYKSFELMHTTVRDVICVFILLILDILILVVFRRIMSNKKNVVSKSHSASRSSSFKKKSCERRSVSIQFIQKISSAENRTTMMILIIGFMTLIGRLPLFYNYIQEEYEQLKKFSYNLCIQAITESFFIINISTSFFIYYLFNRAFKDVFRSLIGLGYTPDESLRVPTPGSLPGKRISEKTSRDAVSKPLINQLKKSIGQQSDKSRIQSTFSQYEIK